MSGSDFWRATVEKANELPSPLPTWKWLEENVELDPVMSDLSGKVRFDFFPASRAFFDHLDHPRLKKATVMKCSQSAFTENAIMYLLRRIKDRPVTAMWVGASAQKTEEDAKKRFFPAIKGCPAVAAISPDESERERWGKRLIMFDTMNLLIRGANSISGLRGDPIGLFIGDERADWKPGRIHKVRQRLTTKSAPVEISIGAAGRKGDELHVDWQEGSQTFIHFLCTECRHSQPFRFGKDPTTLFPEPRALGGLVWEENDVTKPNGQWNFEEVIKSVRLECEKCGHRYHNVEKVSLLKTAHEFHRNPSALPEHFSLAVPALLLIWQKRSWGDIVVEFLKAVEAMRCGDIEPMIAFVTETLGEPWELRSAVNREKEILDRCGKYKTGEWWKNGSDEPEPGSVLILTFDRQLFHLVYVIRQWRKNGQSRLIQCGIKPSYDDLRELQHELKIKNRCVWGDDGGRDTTNFRQTCLRFGWNILKGEDFEHYVISDGEGKSHRQGWRQTEFDPGIGTVSQGRATVPAWLWSRSWFLDRLYRVFIPGKGPLWEIPQDVPSGYLKEVTANEWREKQMNDGGIKGYWHTTGPDHLGDCELEQIVVADIGAITRYLPRQEKGLQNTPDGELVVL